MMETAVFGGSFNPPTNAHAAVIEACLRLETINQVWVMPSGDRLDKQFSVTESARVEMVRLMIDEVFGGDTRVKLCRFELDRLARPSQTWRTVEALSDEYPEQRFRYVFGSDAYTQMPLWQHGERLQKVLPMIVAVRGERCQIDSPNVITIEPVYEVALSSTQVRQNISKGQPIEGFVCNSVAEYIEENGLYKQKLREVQ
jgi:nicotinate-nucleotide adenylyltransferase